MQVYAYRQFLFGLLVAAFAGSLAGCGRPVLVCASTATMGDRDTMVAALIERGPHFLSGRVAGVPVHFHAGGKEVGHAVTSKIGYAVTTVRIPAGVDMVEAQAVIDGRAMAARAKVFTWHRGRTILVLDIDGTISQTDVATLLRGRWDTGSRPMPGAAETLNRLSERYNLLYLTDRPWALRDKTYEWLEVHSFPGAPVILSPTLRAVRDVEQYKQYMIDDIKRIYPDALIGVGNEPTDATAYSSSGALPIIINGGKGRWFGRQAIVLPAWAEIGRFFDANREILENPQELRSMLVAGGALAVPREPILQPIHMPKPPWRTD